MQIFSGSIPFSGKRAYEVIADVPKGTRPLRSSSPQAIPDRIWDLMEQCWDQYFDRRPKATIIVRRLQVRLEPPKSLAFARHRIRDSPSPTFSRPGSRASLRPRSLSACSDTDISSPESNHRSTNTHLPITKLSSSLWFRRTASHTSALSSPLSVSSELEYNSGLNSGLTVRSLACMYPRPHDVVPQRVYRPSIPAYPGSLQDPIMFYINDKQGCGIACIDALQGRFDNLDEWNEQFSFYQGRITVRILVRSDSGT